MPQTRTRTRPEALHFTPHDEANKLIAQDPAAFLIGWILDQQIKVQKAFAGPLELKRRLGTIDPHELAQMPVERLEEAFTREPTLHRYPVSMAQRVHQAMQVVVDEYGGDVERVWLEADDYADFCKRLGALPGFGKQKLYGVAALLVRRFGLDFTGWEEKIPPYGSLSDVESYEDLLAYQRRKQEYKRQLKQQQADAQQPTG